MEEKNTENQEVIKEVNQNTNEEAIHNKETKKDRKGLAIAAMVLGIVSIVLFCVWYISMPCAILAIVFGILSIKSNKKGMAIAGISTGAIGFVLMVLLYVFLIFVAGFGTFEGLEKMINETREETENIYYEYYNDKYDI